MKWLVRQSILWHRYVGICFCVFFAFWFASGVVMMYARMPEFTEAERLARLPEIDLSTVKVSVADAVARADLKRWPLRIMVGMVGDRPVYRFEAESGPWVTVFADTGEVSHRLEAAAAIQVAAPYEKTSSSKMNVVRELTDVDQWTVYPASRPYLPFQIVAANDDKGTQYYVSEATSTVYLRTTHRSKLLAWFGAIPHWWYIRALRANKLAWRAVMIIASGWGVVMSIAGILAGILRFSPSKRYRFAESRRSSIPYVGWKYWHYLLGAVFGLFTFTWILSGLFSMNPGNWSPGPEPTEAERRAFAGSDLDPGAFRVTPTHAIDLLRNCIRPIEMEMIMFEGQPYYLARQSTDAVRLLPATGESPRCMPQVPVEEILTASRRVAERADVMNSAFLTDYDAYYYDRHHEKPLPVVRVRLTDPQKTWLYVNPRTGLIQARYTDRSRLERWLYNGLHSLDFPFLYRHRPLWDLTVILLSIGGFLLCVTSVILAWKYLQRTGRRWSRMGSAWRWTRENSRSRPAESS